MRSAAELALTPAPDDAAACIARMPGPKYCGVKEARERQSSGRGVARGPGREKLQPFGPETPPGPEHSLTHLADQVRLHRFKSRGACHDLPSWWVREEPGVARGKVGQRVELLLRGFKVSCFCCGLLTPPTREVFLHAR